jgi:WD40 repeat protein
MSTTRLVLVSLIAAHVAVAHVRAEPPAPFYLTTSGWDDDAPITHLAFSPDGKVLASAGKGLVRLWDLATREDYASFEGTGPIGFSSGGNKILAGTKRGGWNYTRTGLPAGGSGLGSDKVQFAISGNGDYLATGVGPALYCLNREAKERDLKKELKDVADSVPSDFRRSSSPESVLTRVAFLAGGNTLVVGPLVREVPPGTAGCEVYILFWDLLKNEKRKIVLAGPRDLGTMSWYGAIAMARDGSTIACLRWDHDSHKGRLEVWDTATGKLTVLSSEAKVLDPTSINTKKLALELSNDGKQLAVKQAEGDVELWDLKTRKKSRTLEIRPDDLKKYASGFDGERCMAFSRDGRQLAVGFGRAIAVYSLER